MAARGWSRAGLVLAGLYAAATLASVLAGLLVEDPKGRFVLLQLPLLPGMLVLAALGQEDAAGEVTWLVAYLLVVPVTLALLYAAGRVAGAAWTRGR